jgi:RNA polymerase sigma factor (sigma-70 family)
MSVGAELAVAPQLDDRTLARRIGAGDRGAFELLMRRYNRRLYRLARTCLRDDSEAKDALQEAYLCAYRSIGQFRGESALSTWLSRLVLNECNARLRRSSRREHIVSIVSTEGHMDVCSRVAAPEEPPDRAIGRAQLRSVLERKLGELPEIFRLVFVMRSIEELSIPEVAAILSISEETVRSRHFRAKGLLRESLAKEIDLAEGDIFEFGGRCCDEMVAAVLAALGSSGESAQARPAAPTRTPASDRGR